MDIFLVLNRKANPFLEGLVEQANDILANNLGGGESLGPFEEDSRVDAGLLDGEGEGEAHFVSGVPIHLEFLHEAVNRRCEEIKELLEE